MRPFHLAVPRLHPQKLQLVAREVITGSQAVFSECPNCEVALTLQQPDIQEPGELLGICECCLSWFLIVEDDENANRCLVLELPSADAIRAMFKSSVDATMQTAAKSG